MDDTTIHEIQKHIQLNTRVFICFTVLRTEIVCIVYTLFIVYTLLYIPQTESLWFVNDCGICERALARIAILQKAEFWENLKLVERH